VLVHASVKLRRVVERDVLLGTDARLSGQARARRANLLAKGTVQAHLLAKRRNRFIAWHFQSLLSFPDHAPALPRRSDTLESRPAATFAASSAGIMPRSLALVLEPPPRCQRGYHGQEALELGRCLPGWQLRKLLARPPAVSGPCSLSIRAPVAAVTRYGLEVEGEGAGQVLALHGFHCLAAQDGLGAAQGLAQPGVLLSRAARTACTHPRAPWLQRSQRACCGARRARRRGARRGQDSQAPARPRAHHHHFHGPRWRRHGPPVWRRRHERAIAAPGAPAPV
jgi:hypothetical protein